MPSRTQALALRRSWLVHYPQQPQLIEGAPLSHTLPGGGTCSTWLRDGSGAVDAAIHDQHVGSEQLLCWCLLLPEGRRHSRRRVTPLVGPCLTPQSEVLRNPKPQGDGPETRLLKTPKLQCALPTRRRGDSSIGSRGMTKTGQRPGTACAAIPTLPSVGLPLHAQTGNLRAQPRCQPQDRICNVAVLMSAPTQRRLQEDA